MRSKDYNDIKDKFRPGHADFTYFKKYGIRDYRGVVDLLQEKQLQELQRVLWQKKF